MRKMVWIVKNLENGKELRFRTSKRAVDYINKNDPNGFIGRYTIETEPLVKKDFDHSDGYGNY